MDEEGVSTVGRLSEWREGAALAWRDPASEVGWLFEGELSEVAESSGATAETDTLPAELPGAEVSI